MLIWPYKYYLRLLERKPRLSIFQKVLIVVVGLTLIVVGTYSALFYWQYQKEMPIRLENAYLETVGSGFFSVQQSVNDVLAGFQIAGVKTDTINKLEEASASSSGFFVMLDQVDKTIATVENAQKNIVFQKKQLTQTPEPLKFKDLHSQLLSFYDESIKVFDDLLAQHRFAKEFLLSAGPNFYLGVLSDESLWQTGKNEEILAYYQDIKTETDNALRRMFNLTPPADFQEQFNTQIAYLELLVKTANNIISLFSQKDDLDVENATQLEKAYQVLIGARRENEALAGKLLSSRSDLFSPEVNLVKFGPIRVHQSTLNANFEDIYAQQRQVKTYSPPIFLRKFIFALLKTSAFVQR